MVKFYKILQSNKEMSIAQALWKAQQWYRKDGTRENVVKLIGEKYVSELESNETKSKRAIGPRPQHSHPVHWAGFICIG